MAGPGSDAADRSAALRALPKIDELLRRPELAAAGPRWAVVEALRQAVEAQRQAAQAGAAVAELDLDQVRRAAARAARRSLRGVINATGVVLHTNLGRAPLHPDAVAHVAAVAAGYGNLEYDLDEGERGSRHDHLRAGLAALTGAEDAVVVNNGAAAVLLALAACATDREVVVSRGELIEIGGSFRIPDVMRLSGATLVEVGTTNKTRVADYAGALGPRTGLLLKVHRSNFALVGFTEEVAAAELAALGRDRAVLSMIDLGSGALLDAAAQRAMGLPVEASVREAVAAGIDLVGFSGDKLLGGPQAGVLVGRRDAIRLVREHPLMRALRPDKLCLAALEATLALYRDGRAAEVPVLAMLAARPEALRARAEALCAAVEPPAGVTIAPLASQGAVGGGALPLAALPSWAAAVSGVDPDALDRALRDGAPPVVARIHHGQVLFDVRTIAPAELELAGQALAAALRRPGVVAWR